MTVRHVGEDHLRFDNFLPSPLDPELCPAVAEAVAQQARVEGLARKPRAPSLRALANVAASAKRNRHSCVRSRRVMPKQPQPDPSKGRKE